MIETVASDNIGNVVAFVASNTGANGKTLANGGLLMICEGRVRARAKAPQARSRPPFRRPPVAPASVDSRGRTTASIWYQ